MKNQEICKALGITKFTLCNWVKNGRIQYKTLPSGRYDYILPSAFETTSTATKAVIYARVSTHDQKDNLERQVQRLKSFASARGLVVSEVIQEVGSALNYNRKGYRKLFEEVTTKQVAVVIAEYKDRIVRFGFNDFKELCKLSSTELIIVDEVEEKSAGTELVEDMIAIVHHFSARLYSARKRKKIEQAIKDPE